MTKQELQHNVTEISKKLCRLEKDVVDLPTQLNVEPIGFNYSEQSQKVALSSEYITRRLRNLVYATAYPITHQEYLQNAANALYISILQDNDGIVEIILPCLVPKRNKRGIRFIYGPLFEALDAFVTSKFPHFTRFEKCAICVTHMHNKTLGTWGRIRDL